jgi:DNA gyrase/topoisomerase IV subunit A
MADTHEHADLQKRIAEYQEDISELDRQVAIFMDALRYCISKFSPEDLAKDWRLGMIKIVTENQG